MEIKAEQRSDLWKSDLEWKDYETYVFGSLQRLLPDAKVTQNIKIKGTLTGRSRQIDILVERCFQGLAVKIAVDCKCFARKVNVKDVETFLGMLEDLDIRKGALVTPKGYTKSAYKRALLGSRQTELRIISPERLSEFQHMGCAFAWVEPVAAVVSPPDGWVVDNEDSRPDRMQFVMYELGHTRDSALRRGAFIYGNIVLKREGRPSIEAIAGWHEERTIKAYPHARFERLAPPQLPAGPFGEPPITILRKGYQEMGDDWPEFSLYIDQPGGVLVLVLHCAKVQEAEYLPKLLWVAEKTILMRVQDTRLERSHEVSGRILVFWNRAKYVELLVRATTAEPWRLDQSFVLITQPFRPLNQCAETKRDLEQSTKFRACEFLSLKFSVQPAWRIDLPGEGWAIPLWRADEGGEKPGILLHPCDSGEPVEFVDPVDLVFFTSTCRPLSPDEWPAIPGIDG